MSGPPCGSPAPFIESETITPRLSRAGVMRGGCRRGQAHGTPAATRTVSLAATALEAEETALARLTDQPGTGTVI